MPKAFFPKAMQLATFQRTLHFSAGWQEIPDDLVDHWWLRAQGVAVTVRPT